MQLKHLLAQSSIYAHIIAEKLAKDTQERRKRDDAAGKRAATKEKKQAVKQANAGQERRSGRAAAVKAQNGSKPTNATTVAPPKREVSRARSLKASLNRL